MSKFSYKDKRAGKLQDALLDSLSMEDKDDLSAEEISALTDADFRAVPHDSSKAEITGYSNYSYWRSTLKIFLQSKLAVAMLLIIGIMFLFTIIQPLLPGQYDANLVINYPAGHDKAGMTMNNIRPNAQFWFGTNNVGQDLWARIWAGTRNSLFIGIVVALIEAFVGIIIGLLWGYVRKLDFLLTEVYNVLNNIPTSIIMILATYIMKPGIKTMIIAMSLTGWIGLARFVRNQVLIIRDRDFNLASRCLGTPTQRIITKNLLPHMVSVVMLRMALAIPGAIGSEVFLTYIGLGMPIDVPSLGNLVNSGRKLMMAPSTRYQLIIPAIFLSIITVCFYLVGNTFSDAADPRNHV